MADLLEVVIENISRSKVSSVLTIILDNAREVTNVRCSEPISFLSEKRISHNEIESFLNLSGNASLFVNLIDFRVNSVVISSVLLRLIKYDTHFDIDFNFDEHDTELVNTVVLMNEIHRFLINICERYDIADYFGGLEPASDIETRYFTGKGKGPLAKVIKPAGN